MRRIAAFAMSDPNHFGTPQMVVAELARAGAEVRFWTDRRFAQRVAEAGAQFADVFASGPLESVDDCSSPWPARFVTYAGVHGQAIIEEVARFKPDLVLYDGFAVVARVVAAALSIPAVIVNSAHGIYGPEFRPVLAREPRVAIDARCHAAVERLRSAFGIQDASPFSYVADPSPVLNIHVEPKEWYTEAQKAKLGPLAYFGAVPDRSFARPQRHGGRPRVLVSFGTIVWRYWTAEALAALAAIADGVEASGAEGVMTVGGATVSDEALAALVRPGVRVERFLDQWKELGEADVFITHHGIGSTHESVARGTPMLSFPFFWDQPQLAARAQEFGLALPLAGALGPEADLTAQQVRERVDDILSRRAQVLAALESARAWERRTIAGRPALAQRIIDLV
ncbi:MAG TPA: glycosyltransferase [Devosia sp.]|nr:glycosyltransferase [Devosia sp.]